MTTLSSEPGFVFYDANSMRKLMLVEHGVMAGWLCYKHPDGQWVTLRKATEDDLGRIALLKKMLSEWFKIEEPK